MINKLKINKKTKFKVLIIISLVLLVFLLGFRTSLGRYVYNVIRNYYLASKDFYLNSDKLSKEHSEFEIENNWSGAETYQITVNVNSKKNDLVFADSDISYNISVTCSNNVTYELSKESGTIVGSANGGINEDFFIVYVTPAAGTTLADGDTAWVDITVTSTSPYVDSISGKLIIGVGREDITYEIIDSPNTPYVEVNITNSLNEDKDVTLEFSPQIVLLDMTSNFTINANLLYTTTLNGYNYVNKIVANVNALETISVKLYKVDKTQDYTHLLGDTGIPIVTLSYESD